MKNFKKKILTVLIILCLLVPCVYIFSSCGFSSKQASYVSFRDYYGNVYLEYYYEDGDTITYPSEEPHLDGYDFIGWCVNGDSSQPFTENYFLYNGYASVSLYPCFELTIYHANFYIDGVLIDTLEFTIDDPYFNDYEMTEIPEKVGYHGEWEDFDFEFSDVDINFKSESISNVTSLELDTSTGSKRSNQNLPKEIKQLLIDIQALDDADVSRACRDNRDKPMSSLKVNERMPRFTNAFNKMFSALSYSRVENRHRHKEILFEKNGTPISIDQLSSGEKQIVYRGCFLLKDVNAMNGAFVFIDEPEISLHPNWQEKIMDYYKGIFTNSDGKQTSQIFAVTHSPFVIHNDNRRNDKVIILTRDANGNIVVKDKADYYKCNSIEAVQDAFSIRNFTEEKSVVYLEGRTDELYFKKAVEVFGYTNLPFEFQWIGYMKNEKDEENTGKDALNKAVAFLIGRKLSTKNICLFDCDTSKTESVKNNVYTRVIPTYSNSKKMKKGIENALVLDSFDVSPYYSTKIKEGDYGDDNTIVTLEKMDLCNAICALDGETLKEIMQNLKSVIDSLVSIFKED